MEKYGKLDKFGNIEFPPRNKDGISNWYCDEELVLANGYLPIKDTNEPDDGKVYQKQYVQKDNIIEVKYIEITVSDEELQAKRQSLYKETNDALETAKNDLRIAKAQLSDYNYLEIKIATGRAKKEDYIEQLTEMKLLDEKIEQLENVISILTNQEK